MLKLSSLFKTTKTDLSTTSLSSTHGASEYADRLAALLGSRGVDVDVNQGSLSRIPVFGSVMILANDPLLGLSSLGLMRLAAQVRQDFKIIAPPQLMRELSEELDASHLISTQIPDAEQYKEAFTHLASGGLLIVQPVHFGQSEGIPKLTQERWPSEFLQLAESTSCRLLHVHISSNELPLLQQVRALYRQPSILRDIAQTLLPQTFDLQLKIGYVIEPDQYKNLQLREKIKTKLLRKQLYRVAEGKSSYFSSLPDIASAEPKETLLEELAKALEIGRTKDGKLIYLTELREDAALLREIGRLREEAFRLVGEGSGKSLDIDRFDVSYQHIVLWDEDDKEIVGAYRLKPTHEIRPDGLYTSTLMNYHPSAETMLERGVELGRSFVQPKYWGSRSLDYLWMGIAAYLRLNPRVRYLFGAVSISNSYSQQAKDLLLGYYSRYYLDPNPIVECKMPYQFSATATALTERVYDGLDNKQAFIVLKEQLSVLGHSVPTLYKQYTELCNDGGALFHGFNIDPDFQDCIDGLVVVDLTKLKPLKRKRYDLLEHDFLAFEQSA